MRKLLAGAALFLLLGLGLVLVFREPLQQMVDDRLTRDMFVPAVAADPSLGPAPGASLPLLQASLNGHSEVHCYI